MINNYLRSNTQTKKQNHQSQGCLLKSLQKIVFLIINSQNKKIKEKQAGG